MNYLEILNVCKSGKVGIIPNWIGYLKWDNSINLLYFQNKDYKLYQKDLEKMIKNRTDLYYIT